jgi:hypothetical protein
MVTRVGPVRRALRIAADDEAHLRADLCHGRLAAGLSRETVGKAIGLPRTVVERIEAGTRRTTLAEYAAFGAAIGQDVRLKGYPAGDPIRDAGQIRLLERLRARLHPSLRWSTEVPLPIEGDLRAWDAVIGDGGWRLPVEAETVLEDLQALERRLMLKQRDAGEPHLLLLVAATPRNRRALASAPGAFAELTLRTRDVLRALESGAHPDGSGIVLL